MSTQHATNPLGVHALVWVGGTTPEAVEVGGVRMELSGRRVLVDGAEVKQRTSSSSTVATASCTHFAIE